MKYHLLICMIFAAFQSVCSIADNHVWCMAVMQNGEKEPTFLQYAGIQDTIVNGIAYYTIYDDNVIVDYCSMRLPYGYRMADKKIMSTITKIIRRPLDLILISRSAIALRPIMACSGRLCLLRIHW